MVCPTWLNITTFGVTYEEEVCACGCGAHRKRYRSQSGGVGPWQPVQANEAAGDRAILASLGIAAP